MDEHTQDVLEFPEVLALISGYAHSAQGRAELLNTRPAPNPEDADLCLDEFDEASRFLMRQGRIACDLSDPTPFLEATGRPDCYLEPVDLLAVAQYLRFIEQVRRQLEAADYPALAARLAAAPSPPFLLNRIENALDARGEIRDTAHPELRPIRQRQERARHQLQDQLNRLIQGPKSKYLAPEAFVTQRSDRYVVPVRVECQREVPGLVHGTSSSGATVFVEPFGVVDLNNEYVFARERESEIIREVLAGLSRDVFGHREAMVRIVEVSGLVDARFAVAVWAAEYQCSRPQLVRHGVLELRRARHPLLIRALGFAQVVAIDVELSPESPVLVISGPNTGGKTAALKTVGLMCLMARSGLPVPARQASLPWFQAIFADIGDFQSIVHHLSTFSSHLARVIRILGEHKARALVLLDELGRGTDPVYGAALATAVIDWFLSEGSFVLATTHHRAVKLYAASTPGVRNASVLLDPETQRPTYAIEYGVAGDSSGLEIARQLGLPGTILRRAESLLDARDRQWEEYLKELRTGLARVKQEEEELSERRRQLEEMEARIRRQALADEAARQKEFEQALDRMADEFRREGSHWLKQQQDEGQAREARRRIALREAALKETFRRRRQVEAEPGPKVTPADSLHVGDFVYHPLYRLRGRVEAVDGNQVRVDVGGKSLTTRLQDLRRIETRETEEKPAPDVTIRVVQSTDPELTLIGMTVDEAEDSLDKYLDRAFVSRLPEVSIIHGFGTGRLKRSVSEFLARHPQVESFEVEGGVTRVILKS